LRLVLTILKGMGLSLLVWAAVLIALGIGVGTLVFVAERPVLIVVVAAACVTAYWYFRRRRPQYYVVPVTRSYVPFPYSNGDERRHMFVLVQMFVVRAKDRSSAGRVVRQLLDHTAYLKLAWDRGTDESWGTGYADCKERNGSSCRLTLHSAHSSHMTLSLAENAANRLVSPPLVKMFEPALGVSASVEKNWPTSGGLDLVEGRPVAKPTTNS
jgi:hypothetical protein